MTRPAHNVTYRRRRLEQNERPLAPEFNEYVGVVEYLDEANVLSELPDRFRLNRSGGYAGFDLVISTLAFVSCILMYCSLGKFCYYVRRNFNQPMAALVGRRDFPSQPSMSRMFDAVDEREVDAFERWILSDALDGSLVWNEESVLHRDCLGKGCHVFSFDHTVTALRQRALPEGPDLPAPRRHADGFAAPGYMGRKRGEVMVTRGTLQHRGTRLWHGVTLKAGNGDLEVDLEHAADCVLLWAERAQVDLEDCIIVIDGAGGGWTQVEVLAPKSVHFVVRLAHYRPLQDPERLAMLLAQPWTAVRDSLSGPKRWATELGTIERDGRSVRLVVTRFQPADGKKHGAGVLIDGWQYEVFATRLAADHWPAAEVATLYYGRCGEENDFAREDASLKLDHIVSFNLPGQRLFNLLGLWLWNLRILRGAQLQGGLQAVSYVQEVRDVTVEQPGSPSEEDASNKAVDELPNLTEPETGIDKKSQEPFLDERQQDGLTNTNADELPESAVPPSPGMLEQQQGKQAVADLDQTCQQLVAVFERRFGDTDWKFAPDTWSITCPVGHDLRLHQIRVESDETVEVRFRGLESQCKNCSHRRECSSSTKPKFAKEITANVQLPTESRRSHTDALAHIRKTGAALRKARRRLWPGKQSPSRVSAPQQPDPTITPGPLQMRQPFLVTAVLVNVLLDYTRALLIHVNTKTGPFPVPVPRYYAMTDAERQRRRKTWAQRMQWNALPVNSTVTVHIASSEWPNEKQMGGAYAA